MEEEITLQQKYIIERKNTLNFEECLKEDYTEKKYFNKTFRNEIDIYCNAMHNNGVLFYGITINFPELSMDDIMDKIHHRVEQFLFLVKQEIELAEFCYVAIEKHSSKTSTKNSKVIVPILAGKPHLHCIIAVRSLIGKNSNLTNEIKSVFCEIYEDIVIKPLSSIKQTKDYWNYVIKENNWKFHRMVNYSEHYQYQFGRLVEHEVRLLKNDLKIDDQEFSWFFGGQILDSKAQEYRGIGKLNVKPKLILLYLINLYLKIKNIMISNNEFYTKIEKSRFSWEYLDSIEYLKKNNIFILHEIKKMFPQQLNHINISELLLENFKSLVQEIKENNHYLPEITFNTDLLEFSDGVYLMDYDHFIDYYKNKELVDRLKIATYKYFNNTYNYCNTAPKLWLAAIHQNIPVVDEFCADLGAYFHSRKEISKKKKKTICILGGSNTGKTTLVVNILTEYLGANNIGMISGDDKFAFEQLEDKKVIICDEFKYSANNLKVGNNEPILLDKKTYINKAPILFMFNNNINNKMLKDQAFINRLLIYTFSYTIKDPDPNMKQILLKELPNILIYCNKKFFEKKEIKKWFETKNLKIKMIENYILKLIN